MQLRDALKAAFLPDRVSWYPRLKLSIFYHQVLQINFLTSVATNIVLLQAKLTVHSDFWSTLSTLVMNYTNRH